MVYPYMKFLTKVRLTYQRGWSAYRENAGIQLPPGTEDSQIAKAADALDDHIVIAVHGSTPWLSSKMQPVTSAEAAVLTVLLSSQADQCYQQTLSFGAMATDRLVSPYP